ncbi:MAG: VWA domain-containing protein [Terriglobales bacterium]
MTHLRPIAALLAATLWIFLPCARAQAAPQGPLVFRAEVNVVGLNIAVTDRHGRYVTGLKPADFAITEDGIAESIASFQEGNGVPLTLAAAAPAPAAAPADAAATDRAPEAPPRTDARPVTAAGASIYVLMDTSNYMYQGLGFVHAQDAIVGFIRSLARADRVAFYSYSRNLSRQTLLTFSRPALVRGVRTTVNGDQAALYDALLLTLRDARHVAGRKVVVVFSNGPDNSSLVPPSDVSELAQSEGIPIYVVSTRHARENPVFAAAMRRLSSDTGGEAFFARRWQNERTAFAIIRDDLQHLYFLSYYPKPNPNDGWRTIHVRLVGEQFKHDRIRTRNGYQFRPAPPAGAVSPHQ